MDIMLNQEFYDRMRSAGDVRVGLTLLQQQATPTRQTSTDYSYIESTRTSALDELRQDIVDVTLSRTTC